MVEFVEIWLKLRDLALTEDMPGTVHWKLTVNGKYSAKSAYGLFFVGYCEVPKLRRSGDQGLR
jgi:hypothetical protein